MHLDHVTIRTRDLPATRTFFLDVFDGLEERDRPQAIQRIPGHWLFAGNRPLIHLIGSRGNGIDHAAEAIDHIGIAVEGYADFRAKLDAKGVSYSAMDLPELDERRLFFHAPGGPLLEAVFKEPLSEKKDQ